MRNAIATIASIALLGAAAARAQTVTDVTPPPPQAAPPPPAFEVALAPEQCASVHAALLPLMHPSNHVVRSLEVRVEQGATGPGRAMLLIAAELSAEQASAVRAQIAPLWPLPQSAKARPIESITATVTNSGAASVLLRYR